MADTAESVDAELKEVRGEIQQCYDAMRGLVGGGEEEEDDAGEKADKIFRDLDALFTRRGALLRRRAEFPTGVDAASN